MLQPNSELQIIKTSPPTPSSHHQSPCPPSQSVGIPVSNLRNMVTLEPIPGTSLPPKSSATSPNSNSNRSSPQPPHLLQRKSNEGGTGNCYLIPNKPELTVTLVGGSGNGQRKSPILESPEISLSIEPVKEIDEDEQPIECKDLVLIEDDDELKSLSPNSVSDEPKKKRQKTSPLTQSVLTPVSLPLAPSNYRTRTVSKAAAAAAAIQATGQVRTPTPVSSPAALSSPMPQKQTVSPSAMAPVGLGLSPAAAMKPSRIGAGRPRKQLTTAEQLEQLKKKDGIIDIETPGSVLTLVSNLKAVVNKFSFSLLPCDCQEQLLRLLPDSIPSRDGTLALNPTAFENEFFAKALEVWKAKLIAGELTREHKLKLKQEADKRKLELDSWKLKYYQPIWGKKNNAPSKSSVPTATNSVPKKQPPPPLPPMSNLAIKEEALQNSTLRTSPRLSSNINTNLQPVSTTVTAVSDDSSTKNIVPFPSIKVEEPELKPQKLIFSPIKQAQAPKSQSPPILLLSPGKRGSEHLNHKSDSGLQAVAAKKIRIIPPLHPSVNTHKMETETKDEPKPSDITRVPSSEVNTKSTNQPVMEFVPSADEDDTLLLCSSNEIPLVDVDQTDCSLESKPQVPHESPVKFKPELMSLPIEKKKVEDVVKATVTAALIVPVSSAPPTTALSITPTSNISVLSTPPPLQISGNLTTFQRLPVPLPLQIPQQITLATTAQTRPQGTGALVRSPQQVMLRMVAVPPPSGQPGDARLKLVQTLPLSQPITTASTTSTNQVSMMIKVPQSTPSTIGLTLGVPKTTSCVTPAPQVPPVLSTDTTKAPATSGVLIPITTKDLIQFHQSQNMSVTQAPVQIQLSQSVTAASGTVPIRHPTLQQIVSIQKPIRPNLLLHTHNSGTLVPTPISVTRPVVPTPLTLQATTTVSSQPSVTPTTTTAASARPVKKHSITNRPKLQKKLSSVPPGSINLERSYQICQAVIQSSSNRDKLQKHLVKPAPLPNNNNNNKKEEAPAQPQQVQPQSQALPIPVTGQNQVKVSEPPKMIHINRKPSTPTLIPTSGMPTMQLLNGISGTGTPPQQKLIVVSGPQGQSLQMMSAQHQNQSLIRPGSPVIQLGTPGGLGNLVVSPDNSHPQHLQPAPLDPSISMSVALGPRCTGTNTTTSTTASTTFKHHGNGNALLNLNVFNHKLYKPNNLHQQSQSTAIGMPNTSVPNAAPHQSMTTATVITQEQLAMLLQKRRQQPQPSATMNLNTRFTNPNPNPSTYLNLNPSSPNHTSLPPSSKVVLRNGSSPQPPPLGNMSQPPTGRQIRIIRPPFQQQRLLTQQQFLRVPISKSELTNGNGTGYPIRAQFVTRNGETFLIRTPIRLPPNQNAQRLPNLNMNLRPQVRIVHRTSVPESQSRPSSPCQNPGSPSSQSFSYGTAPERSPVSNLTEFINSQMASMRSISPLAMEENGGRANSSPNSMNTLVHSPQRDQPQGSRTYVIRQHPQQHMQHILSEELLEFHQNQIPYDSSVPIELEVGEHMEWFNTNSRASTTSPSPNTFPHTQNQTNFSQVPFLPPNNESSVHRHGHPRSPMIQSLPGPVQSIVSNSSTPRPTNSNLLTHHITNNESNDSDVLVQAQTPQSIESQATIQQQQQPQQYFIVQTPGVNGVVQNIAVPASFVLSPQVILDQQKGNTGATTVLNTGNQNQVRIQQMQGPPRASSAPPTNNLNQTGTVILNSVSGQVQHQQQFTMAPPPTSQFSGDNSSGIRILYNNSTQPGNMPITNQSQPPTSTYCITPTSVHTNVVHVHQHQSNGPSNMNILHQSHQQNTALQQQILNVENQAAWISEQLNGVAGGSGHLGVSTPGTTIVDVNLNGSSASAQIIPGQHPVISIPDPGGSSNVTGTGGSGNSNNTGQNGNGITFSGQDFDIFLANVTGSGAGNPGTNGENVNINLNENNSVSVTFPMSMTNSKSMKTEQILLGPPPPSNSQGNSLQNGNCICDLRALIMCKKCGAYCQRDCMSTSDHCMTCA